MRTLLSMAAAALAVASTLAPIAAEAQAQSSPRIVMRRPLNPSSTLGTVTPACGTEGQPACPTDCEFVGAMWEVGQWSGAACGDGKPVTREVRCMGIRANGQRAPRDDSFCLQDMATFRNNCGGSAPQNPVIH